MEIMVVLGYAAAIVIGISLGLIGGGGSILTVPVLVYLLNIPPVEATAYSLFIVGLTSLVSGSVYLRRGLVDVKTAILFGIPSILAVFATRRFIIPAIPEEIVSLGTFNITRDLLLMVLFALLMVFASVSMIRKQKPKQPKLTADGKRHFNYPAILMEGAVVGTLTGLVGAGGGFLIIPALVIFSGLDMKKAIGTSLVIIAAKSLLGFTGDMTNPELFIDWKLLGIFSALAVSGSFIGITIAGKVSAQKLKVGFGWFVLAMGLYILGKELLG
ncbi:sulfite exporter TauE/SafE family protein [soil metagenome]